MFIPDTFAVALPCILTCLFFWGTWSNPVKSFDHPFPLFYITYSFFGWFTALMAALILGGEFMPPQLGVSVAHNLLYEVSGKAVLYSLLAGLVFNLANISLIIAISIAGLSVAFPIVIGTALVLGTTLTYIVQPSGNAFLLFGGVALATCAIIADSIMHRIVNKAAAERPPPAATVEARPLLVLNDDEAAAPAPAPAPHVSQRRSMVICIIGGILMGSWSPLATLAQSSSEHPMSPYGGFLGITTGCLLCTMVVIPIMMRFPVVGDKCTFKQFCALPLRQHCCGLSAGVMWATGTLMNLVAGKAVGYAVSYAAGSGGTLVGACWGLYYGELNGAPLSAKVLFCVMALLYVGAVTVIGISHST